MFDSAGYHCFATTRIKRMYPVLLMHDWFIFNLNTKSRYSQIKYASIFIQDIAHVNPAPCSSLSALFYLPPLIYVTHFFIYLENQLSCSWHEYPSTLDPGLLTLFTLCHFSHPNTPQRSSYNIYIDNINNISRPDWYNPCIRSRGCLMCWCRLLLVCTRILHMWVGLKGWFKDSEGRGGASIMQMGQYSYRADSLATARDLKWKGIRTHSSTATIPSKGFIFKEW